MISEPLFFTPLDAFPTSTNVVSGYDAMILDMPTLTVTVSAPAKVILFGEHAVNRGQPALATTIGLITSCRVRECDGREIRIAGAQQAAVYTTDFLLAHANRLDALLTARDYLGVSKEVGADFFCSSAYMLGRALRDFGLPSLDISLESEVPMSCGLGSGGAVHAALALAVSRWLIGRGLSRADSERYVSGLAYAGDRIAHGGVASGLDTQTSLVGGVIRYKDAERAVRIAMPPGLQLVVGQTGVPKGSTGSVNLRVRTWLEEDPGRLAVFESMGRVAANASVELEQGNWPAVGRLMNENHELLSMVGASHPMLDRLCAASLSAGAWGAKLTGAGGGGVMIALVAPDTAEAVAAAIDAAGGKALQAPVAVGGASFVQGEGSS